MTQGLVIFIQFINNAVSFKKNIHCEILELIGTVQIYFRYFS